MPCDRKQTKKVDNGVQFGDSIVCRILPMFRCVLGASRTQWSLALPQTSLAETFAATRMFTVQKDSLSGIAVGRTIDI